LNVELTKRAVKDLDGVKRAQPVVFEKILAKIQSLLEDPKAGKQLVGPLKGIWSLRVGDYRILFQRMKTSVVILTVNHRREVYK
jgi:mRNA interferase RelE/StbE